MSTVIDHQDAPIGYIHTIANWIFGTLAERDAYTDVTAKDFHKIAYVTAEAAYYSLIAIDIGTGARTWIPIATISGGTSTTISRNIVLMTASATLINLNYTDVICLVQGAYIPTLPTAVGNTNIYTIKNNHTSNITVNTTSAQTIDGSATIALAPEEAITVVSTTTNWSII